MIRVYKSLLDKLDIKIKIGNLPLIINMINFSDKTYR